MPFQKQPGQIRLFHIPGFDTLRFFAASAIIFCHIELVKYYRGLPALVSETTIYETGKLAVGAFFALSGFLITRLLIQEQSKHGNISLRNFYMRRILRIWPLYYLILLLVFFLLPHFQIFQLPVQSAELQNNLVLKLIFCLLLLPQMLLVKFGPIPGAEQLWTIGTEEIFYFLWPLLLSKTKHALRWAGLIIISYLVIRFSLYQFSGHAPWRQHPGLLYRTYLVLYYNRIDCLLLGAGAAILTYNQHKWWLALVGHRLLCIIVTASTLLLFIMGVNFMPIDYFFYSLAFAWLISAIAVAHFKKPAQTFFTEKMGRVSYGIYLWHFIIVLLAFAAKDFFYPRPQEHPIINQVFLYVFAYLFSYLAALVSHYYFETYFLQLKEKFSR